jgi:hypothetical protein
MEKIEKLISEKTEEVNSLKPKHYLIKGYLSTFLSLQWLPISIVPFIYLFLTFILIDSVDASELKLLLLKITFILTEIFAILLSFEFKFSIKKLNKQFKIDKYQSALNELYILEKKKKILDKANNIKNTL